MPDLSRSALARSLSLLAAVTVGTKPLAADPAEPAGLPPRLGNEHVAIEFTTENGWIYDGRIDLPAPAAKNGWAVMMLGGGLGSPMDWEVPAVMTLDGRPTRDADTIARALLKAGFAVMRWHAIRRGDPMRAKDPLMMDPPPFVQTIEQARKAFAAFVGKNVVPKEKVFLLGHSLGARRAAILLDDNPQISGVIMLAGASLIPADLDKVRQLVADFPPTRAAPHAPSDRHEAIIQLLMQREPQWRKGASAERDRHGERWAVEVLRERNTPFLLIVGELDERWLLEAYLVTARMRLAGRTDFTPSIYANLGHQLGAEVAEDVLHADYGVIAKSRTGPIEPAVVGEIVEWLGSRIR